MVSVVAIPSISSFFIASPRGLAAAGLPNVDTMGVRGGDIHSDQEFVVIDSLIERAKLSTLLLMRLADGTVEVPK